MKIRILTVICIVAGASSLFGQKTLLQACQRHSDFNTIQKFIKLGADVNARDAAGCTPLLLLCSGVEEGDVPVIRPDSIDAIRALAAAGADVNAADPLGNTPLLMALAAMPPSFTKTLLDLHADPQKADTAGTTPLFRACGLWPDSWPLEKAKLLVAAGADINARDKGGTFALQHAIMNTETLKFLLQSKGVDVNAQNWAGDTVLISSARLGDTTLAQTMSILSAGANVDIQNRNGETALFRLGMTNMENTVTELLKAGIDTNLKDGHSRTAVMTHLDKPETVAALIAAGADVTTADQDGNTPLHAASFGVQEKTVRMLVRAGADVNAVNNRGETPLIVAASRDFDNPAIVQDLISSGAEVNRAVQEEGLTALEYALKIGKRQVIKLLIGAGADPNMNINSSRETPFFSAVVLGDEGVLAALLEAGADVNKVDRDGNSPLMLAPTAVVARLLISAGAEVNQQNHWGKTPLLQSISNNKPEVTKCLLDSGADVKAKDSDGNSVLTLSAAFSRSAELIQALLGAGADIENEGSAALLDAMYSPYSSLEKIKTLLEAGADVNAKPRAGLTPLIAACLLRETPAQISPIIEILLEYGADVTARDLNNKTAHDYAMTNVNLKGSGVLQMLK